MRKEKCVKTKTLHLEPFQRRVRNPEEPAAPKDREIARARFEAQSSNRRLRQTEADMQAGAF